MEKKEHFSPDKDQGIARRSFLEGTAAGLGALLIGALPAEAKEKRNYEAIRQALARGAYKIEQNPEQYQKSCDMQSDTGKCDGVEITKPFKAKDFVLKIFWTNKPGGDPNKPTWEFLKKGNSVQVIMYTWEGEESAKATINESDPISPGLHAVLKSLSKVKNK